MKSADLRRLENLYTAAMELPAAQREGYVAAACADDPDLHRRLDRMIADADDAAEFMETPVLPPAAADSPIGDDPLIGTHVGRYLLVRVIGVGGMGVVYEAQQDSPSRRVALKILRPGWVSRSLLRRFEHEAEVLGRLSHPGIAQIHEAGSVEIRGVPQPFFAMEFVDGRPITRYADEQKLTARQRQELMTRVCEAVEHAHQKGVIHRDLKPGNILVDHSGQPKVLDFGVARATNADIAATTMRTHAGQIVGTIAYMSPEQARGRAADLDTRSDVYSLGVLLFELLAGRLPHDIADKSIPEAVRAITEDDPSHLSTIDRSLRGDVETIVAKALERDKDRRYQSAADLAADLRRHLSDEPITARPASTFYQLSKFAKRNKGLVGGVVAAFVALTGALVGVTIQAARIQREKVRAQEAAWFIESVLSASDPYPSTQGASLPEYFGANVRVIDFLAGMLKQLDSRPRLDAVTHAGFRQKMSMSFFGVGRFANGADSARRALQLLSTEAGRDDPLVLRSKIGLAFNLAMLMDCQEAARIANEAVTGCVRVYGEHHEETLRALQCLWLCYLYEGYIEDCIKVTDRMLDIVRASPHLNYAAFSIRSEVAANLIRTGRQREGRDLARKALAEGLASHAGRTHWVAYTHFAIARAELMLDNVAVADEHARKGLAIWTAIAGDIGALEFQAETGFYVSAGLPITDRRSDEDQNAYDQRVDMAQKVNDERRENGLKMIADAAAMGRQRFGPDSPLTARMTYLHALRLKQFNLWDRAEGPYREYFAIVDRAGVAHTHWNVEATYEYAEVLLAQARSATAKGKELSAQGNTQEAQDRIGQAHAKLKEAESTLRDGIGIAEVFTRDQWLRCEWDDRLLHTLLAKLLHEQQREAEAAPFIAFVAQHLDEPSKPEQANDIAWRLFELGRPDLCEPIARRAVLDLRDLRKRGEGPYAKVFVYTLDTWAASLRALNRHEDAQAAWHEGETAWIAEPGRPSPYAGIARRHADCLIALGRFEPAESILLTSLANLRADPTTKPELIRLADAAIAAMYDAWAKPERAAKYRAGKQ